jgi:hypothetical protein
MTRVVLNEALRTLFKDFTQPLELCDESGHVVGRFEPTADVDLSEYEKWEPEFTEEELRQAEQDPVSFSTDEVLAYLRSLPCSESGGNGSQ